MEIRIGEKETKSKTTSKRVTEIHWYEMKDI